MSYIYRTSDEEINRKLEAAGAMLIRGPKACGKTASGRQFSKSILQVDQDTQVQLLMDTDPTRLLVGETPRLIDEWQEQPKLWNYVRHEVDNRKKSGQFILTGSTNPVESVKMHSGAGRFTIVDMRTMSWYELGISTGQVSLKELMEGERIHVKDESMDLEQIVERIIIGGFPGLIKKSLPHSIDVNRAYIELLAEVDMSRVSDISRDPVKVRNLLRSLARNTSTLADITTLEKDIKAVDNEQLTRPTIYDYLDCLNRLMIVEDQPAWNPHIRSSASLRKSVKRHFTDVSLAVASLNLSKKNLINNLKYVGFLFESMAIHDLRVYAQANNSKVFHYRDSTGLEIDAIVQNTDGEWSAFEIKLGTSQLEEAAFNLKKLVSILDTDKMKMPQSLNIITGTGISFTRNDGINVISLASLGV